MTGGKDDLILSNAEVSGKPAAELPGVKLSKDKTAYLDSNDYRRVLGQVDRLSMLMDVARSIMAEIELDALLEKIIDIVTQVMRADRSTLFLVDAEKAQIWSRVAQGASEIRLPLGAGIVGSVAQTGQTANIPDAYKDDRFNPDFDQKTGYKTRSILCMAIMNPKAEIIGAIQVLNKNDGTAFNADDENLLAAFCSLAGISLENARAYDELEQERNSLEIKVKERTKDLAAEKEKSDQLLLNILPQETADELKENGAAAPQGYDSVSIMFTDFKGFTKVAEQMSPSDLITNLDKCFYYFDEVIDRHRLEKIKTIGDAYMCAGGLPIKNGSHPFDICLAALEIAAFMDELKQSKIKTGLPYWELRLGVNTGPVVAGVVGKRKFAYDIWGDSVNLAARMESSGEAGRVNLSAATYSIVKDYFDCTHRGKVAAKNKGEVDMYFINRIKPEYSADDRGLEPNQEFRGHIESLRKV